MIRRSCTSARRWMLYRLSTVTSISFANCSGRTSCKSNTSMTLRYRAFGIFCNAACKSNWRSVGTTTLWSCHILSFRVVVEVFLSLLYVFSGKILRQQHLPISSVCCGGQTDVPCTSCFGQGIGRVPGAGHLLAHYCRRHLP